MGMHRVSAEKPVVASAEAPPWSHHRVEVNGIRLYYRRAGSGGEPVVLLHGFPETSYAWRKVIPALAEQFTVIAPGALRGGISYFRAHRLDAEHNRENAKTPLPMPVLTVGGTAGFEANLAGEIRPLAKNVRSMMIENCGHYLAEEQPEQVVAELRRFFNEATS